MVNPPALEIALGMERYSTSFQGIGGRLKRRFEDFIVEEIDSSGLVSSVNLDLDSPFMRENLEVSGDRRKARYLHLTIQKMGLTTIDAASLISSSLKISRHMVNYAGLKDKRALTVQKMSIPVTSLEAIRKTYLSRIWINCMEYSRRQLHIGDLWGNRFSIIVRNIDASCEDALEKVNELGQSVLLNYFGVQRFGITRPITHLIGRALIKRDYQEAVRLMLSETDSYDSDDVRNMRQSLMDGPINESILDQIPEGLRYERIVIKSLIKNPDNYELAVSRIPPRIQTLFVHSYQSYLFNRFISLRAKEGLGFSEPEVGDFIMKLDMAHTGRDEWLFVTERNVEERRELVQSGKYGLAGAIPGYASKLPSTKQSEQLQQILKDEGIQLADFRFEGNRHLDSAGGFHLISITLPDLEAKCIEDGILMNFSLRKGSYATVVVRELMKNDPINRV
ncbi:MAG: tRNA pseudouridine(13) synthase TruD [Candidatus Thorarchaeota archaeon]